MKSEQLWLVYASHGVLSAVLYTTCHSRPHAFMAFGFAVAAFIARHALQPPVKLPEARLVKDTHPTPGKASDE